MFNIIAIITPYFKNGKINFLILKLLLNFFIFNKIKTILIFGTTGENYIFNNIVFYNYCIFIKKFKLNFFFGISNNKLKDAIKNAFIAKINNIKSILINYPYYILPNNLGIFKYFKILNKLGVPIILYYIPKRIGFKLNLFTIKKIFNNKFFFSIKNSYNFKKNNIIFKKNFNCLLLSGDDEKLFFSLKYNLSGTISVLNNIIPKTIKYIKKINFFFFKKFCFNINPLFIKYLLFKNKLNNFLLINPLIGINYFFFTQSQT